MRTLLPVHLATGWALSRKTLYIFTHKETIGNTFIKWLSDNGKGHSTFLYTRCPWGGLKWTSITFEVYFLFQDYKQRNESYTDIERFNFLQKIIFFLFF